MMEYERLQAQLQAERQAREKLEAEAAALREALAVCEEFIDLADYRDDPDYAGTWDERRKHALAAARAALSGDAGKALLERIRQKNEALKKAVATLEVAVRAGLKGFSAAEAEEIVSKHSVLSELRAALRGTEP